MILLRFMIVAVCVLASASALDHEEYLVGTLNNQPLANMHLVMKTVEVDGISLTETQATTEIVMKRQLASAKLFSQFANLIGCLKTSRALLKCCWNKKREARGR